MWQAVLNSELIECRMSIPGVDIIRYPNETTRLLFERLSCRDFSDKKMPADVLQFVLEAGIHAPTVA